MRHLAVLAVALACAAMVVVGVAQGLRDVTGVVLLVLVLLTGALAVAALQRVGNRAVGPRRCPECGGLNSAQAPYCKHCAAGLDQSIEV